MFPTAPELARNRQSTEWAADGLSPVPATAKAPQAERRGCSKPKLRCVSLSKTPLKYGWVRVRQGTSAKAYQLGHTDWVSAGFLERGPSRRHAAPPGFPAQIAALTRQATHRHGPLPARSRQRSPVPGCRSLYGPCREQVSALHRGLTPPRRGHARAEKADRPAREPPRSAR